MIAATAQRRQVSVPLMQRELWRSRELCEMLGMRRSKFLEAAQSREIPQFVEIGGIHFYRRHEILDWIRAGCPHVRNENWRWEPSVKAKLSDVHAQLGREIAEMQTEWNRLDEMLKLGDRIINLRSEP